MKAFYTTVLSLFKRNKTLFKVTFWLTGTGSLLWFLIRVIPKPSRATYPCMRAAAPIMSSFVIYLLSLGGSVVAFRKAREKFAAARYGLAVLLLLVAFILSGVFLARQEFTAQAANRSQYLSGNEEGPLGIARGVHPGRVSWVWNPDVTNENCTNTGDDLWFMDKNTDQAVTDSMLALGLMSLSGQSNCTEAWDAIFRYFNYTHKKGWVGYTAGEKIVVKLNLTSLGNGGRYLAEGMNSTPQLVLALLRQLIDTIGVAQSDISIGDPYRGFSNEYWDKCHASYPDVHYLEGLGTEGREQTELTGDDLFFNSDDNFQSRLPLAYTEAAYMINMPCMKSHGSAGITLAAKNHQGSVIASEQTTENQHMGDYLHYDYPDNPAGRQMGKYRHLVDFMAHRYLGENTLIYIVDALWSGRNWFGTVEKWHMAPFSNDWTSSLFLSEDAVAIESVGFDFLYHEFGNFSANHEDDISPTWVGVEDYIHQAADPSLWPSGITYDPNHADHHEPVGSLGAHDHWNDASNMQYSRNLGYNYGIELVTEPADLVTNLNIHVTGISVPASLAISGETTIEATITPANATNKEVFWESNNPILATVDQNGVITPLGNGQVLITAVSKDGNLKAFTQVTITGVTDVNNLSAKKCIVYPNPVRDWAVIHYSLSENAAVQIEIMTLEGKKVGRSGVISHQAGEQTFVFKPVEYNLADGMYICRVIARGGSTCVYTARIRVSRNQ